MSQHLKEGSISSSTSTGDIEQSQSRQIDDVKRKTYDGSISKWIRKALNKELAVWDFTKRVDSVENAASVNIIYQFVMTQIKHKILMCRADLRRQEENDWAYFDRDRICTIIKAKFSNDNKAYKEGPEAHQARKQAERRKQRRTKAMRSSLTEKWGSASLHALTLEEFHSDDESDSEVANEPRPKNANNAV
ncbi:hypothetical protein G6F42_019815 [Rhizopus arrhizus]|nr:hypothetical protein G6F42_019815 [Rhizopus arrhizus]